MVIGVPYSGPFNPPPAESMEGALAWRFTKRQIPGNNWVPTGWEIIKADGILTVDADILLDQQWGESYNVTVREIYGVWEVDGDCMISVVDDCYGHEHDVSAPKLLAAIIKENN
jgi:hypothetical protein